MEVPGRTAHKLERCRAINDLQEGHAHGVIGQWITLIQSESELSSQLGNAVQLADLYAEALVQALLTGEHRRPINFLLPAPPELEKLPDAVRVRLQNQIAGVSRVASPVRSKRLTSPQRLLSPARHTATRMGIQRSPSPRAGGARPQLGSPPRAPAQRPGGSTQKVQKTRQKYKRKRDKKIEQASGASPGPLLGSDPQAAVVAAAARVPRADLRALIAHTAHWVAQHGPELENNIRIRNTPESGVGGAYSFLTHPHSAEGQLYATLLALNQVVKVTEQIIPVSVASTGSAASQHAGGPSPRDAMRTTTETPKAGGGSYGCSKRRVWAWSRCIKHPRYSAITGSCLRGLRCGYHTTAT
eukprot:COSAG02_NODE_1908_length_10422_cov_3.592270_6_plen_357_part_00